MRDQRPSKIIYQLLLIAPLHAKGCLTGLHMQHMNLEMISAIITVVIVKDANVIARMEQGIHLHVFKKMKKVIASIHLNVKVI